MFDLDTNPDANNKTICIGDKVICIDVKDIMILMAQLKLHEIYTVRGFSPHGSVLLEEIDGGYFLKRFKKCST